MKLFIARILAFIRWPVWYELEVRKNLDLKDIEAELQRLALAETTDFVLQRLSHVDSHDAKWGVLSHALNMVEDRNGLYLEFGVFDGGTINFIANKIDNKKIYGFDSFEGLPCRWRDQSGMGAFKVDDLPKVRENVVLIKGWFEKTLSEFLAKHSSSEEKTVSFVHVDSDIYSSAKTVFDLLAPRIKPGTVIVFDEYFNYSGWKDGEFKAFQEFIEHTGFKFKYLSYNRKGEQVSVKIIK